MLSPEPNRLGKCCCASFLVMGGARGNNLLFTLEEISVHAPHHQILKNFTEVGGPGILVGFISRLPVCVCVTSESKALLPPAQLVHSA